MAAYISRTFKDKTSPQICQLCQKQLTKPKLLVPCFHSFCRRCLFTQVKGYGAFNCPTCEIEISIPERGVDGLRDDVFEVNVQLATALEAEESHICVGSSAEDKHKDATVHCTVCKENYCEACRKAHKIFKYSRDHKMIPLDQMTGQKLLESNQTTETYCRRHKEERMRLFCRSCRDIVCIMCAMSDHKQHEYCPIEEEEKARKQVILNGIATLDQSIQADKAHLLEIYQYLDAKQGSLKELRKQVTGRSQELFSRITHDRDRLLALLDSLEGGIKEKKKEAQVEVGKHQSILENAKGFSRKLVIKGKTKEILMYSDDVNDSAGMIGELDIVDDYIMNDIVFTPNENILNSETNLLGMIEETDEMDEHELSELIKGHILVDSVDDPDLDVTPSQNQVFASSSNGNAPVAPPRIKAFTDHSGVAVEPRRHSHQESSTRDSSSLWPNTSRRSQSTSSAVIPHGVRHTDLKKGPDGITEETSSIGESGFSDTSDDGSRQKTGSEGGDMPASDLPQLSPCVTTFNADCGRIYTMRLTRAGGVLVAGEKGIALCQPDGQLEKIPGPFKHPRCALEDGRGWLFVTDSPQGVTNTLYVRKEVGGEWEKWAGQIRWGYLRGMTLNSSGQLMVVNKARKCVCVLNDDGTLFQEVSLVKLGAPCRDPDGIAISHYHGGDITVSDYTNHCVHLFTSTWVYKGTCGTPGQAGLGSGRLNYPCDVHSAAEQGMLVSEQFNHRITLMTGEGEIRGHLLTQKDGLNYPMGVCISRDQHLMVGELSGIIKVYKWQP